MMLSESLGKLKNTDNQFIQSITFFIMEAMCNYLRFSSLNVNDLAQRFHICPNKSVLKGV